MGTRSKGARGEWELEARREGGKWGPEARGEWGPEARGGMNGFT